jgi:hypothetical protein
MRQQSPRRFWYGVGLLVAVSLMAVAPRSEARLLYKKCFDKVYPNIGGSGGKTTCNVCHHGDSKKNLNRYGQALAEELGEKNVTDEDKIIEAIKAIGKPKSPSGDWQDRLEQRSLPCDNQDFSRESSVARQLQRDRSEAR